MKTKFPIYSIGYVVLLILVILYFLPLKVNHNSEQFVLLKGLYVACAYLVLLFVSIREVLCVIKRYFSDGDELLRRFAIIRFVIVFGLCLFLFYFNYVCFDLTEFFALIRTY